SQPHNKTVLPGVSATFSVSATGTAPLSYQWLFNGTNLAGATAATFTRSNAQPATAGGYKVVVTNVAGAITSAVANFSLVNRPLLLSSDDTNGAFTFTLSGNAGFNYAIESSTNLSNWITITILT